MFLGHFGVAMAAKRVAPRPSLGTTIMAAQWADRIWPVFVLPGREHVEIEPGVRGARRMALLEIDRHRVPIVTA